MTEQRVIDNVQTRLETLIGERFTGTYHNIDINCSNYNPDIDTTITVTVTVTDQNDDPVEDYTVPLKIDGTGITGVVTNSSGVATYNYTPTTGGIHKLSVKSVSSFINVGGWKTILNQSGITFYVNESSRTAMLKIYLTDKAFNNTNQYWLTPNGNLTQSAKPQIINEAYLPVTDTVVLNIFSRNNPLAGLVTANTTSGGDVAGAIKFSRTSTGSTNIHAYATWGF